MEDLKNRVRRLEEAAEAKDRKILVWLPDKPKPECKPGDVIIRVVYEDERSVDDFQDTITHQDGETKPQTSATTEAEEGETNG